MLILQNIHKSNHHVHLKLNITSQLYLIKSGGGRDVSKHEDCLSPGSEAEESQKKLLRFSVPGQAGTLWQLYKLLYFSM